MLRWAPSSPFSPSAGISFPSSPPSLPPSNGTYIVTPSGGLGLLISEPAKRSTRNKPSAPPVLLIHGGFGYAAVWIPWMIYLSTRYSGNVYALSLTGHGASWTPSFLSMYFTGLRPLAENVLAAVQEIERREGSRSKCVLVGHSGGGGLVQYVLQEKMVEARAVALIASTPHYGGYDVFWTWMKLDPMLLLRMIIHLGHPKSALSDTALVKKVFFGPRMRDEDVAEFEKWMPNYESMSWVSQMCRKYWIDVRKVLLGLKPDLRMLMMVGEEDRYFTPDKTRVVVDDYRWAAQKLAKEKKVEWNTVSATENRPGMKGDEAFAVQFVIVEGAGHHVQNDVQSETGGEALRAFLERL